jgi:hypothetical protein
MSAEVVALYEFEKWAVRVVMLDGEPFTARC